MAKSASLPATGASSPGLVITASSAAPALPPASNVRPDGTLSTSAPTAAPSATPAIITPTITVTSTGTPCPEAHGQIENQQINSQAYGNGTAFIYLPPCYSAKSALRYPVLYLLHGANTNNTQWIDLGAPVTADRLIQSRQAPAFIIVMPREENYLQNPDQSTYGDWIIHALVPWIDQQYATCTERACRVIGGLSRGGSWAFRIGLIDWQHFSAIGMDSGVPFYGDLAKSESILKQIPPSQRPSFFVDIGQDDAMIAPARMLVAELARQQIPYEWHMWPGAHNRAYWRAHVEDYLRWYVQNWIHLNGK